MTEPKVPAELLLAFGQERVRLSKAYLAATPITRKLVYKLFVDGDVVVTPKLLSELQQFPIKTRTAGKRITLSI